MAYNKVTAERNRLKAARAAKKVTAKKILKKIAKRGRKIAPSKEAQLALPLGDTVTVHDALLNVVDVRPMLEGISTMGEASCPPTNSEILREIEVLDMRALNNADRFMIVAMLSKESYISNQSLKPHVFDVDQICAALTSDAIRLNHINKIATCITWSDAQMSDYISRPSVIPLEVDQEIRFNFPAAPSEDPFVEINGKLYGRIM